MSGPGSSGKPRTIALIGFMAAGKSRGATAIARALGEQATDTDKMLTAQLGSIGEYFSSHGEAAFREAEERVVLQALDGGGVVALGGGVLGSQRIRAALESCVTVLCRVREDVAWQRSRNSGRPLAADRDALPRAV